MPPGWTSEDQWCACAKLSILDIVCKPFRSLERVKQKPKVFHYRNYKIFNDNSLSGWPEQWIIEYKTQPPEVLFKERCSRKFRKIHRKAFVPESLFVKIPRITLFTELLWTTASVKNQYCLTNILLAYPHKKEVYPWKQFSVHDQRHSCRKNAKVCTQTKNL